MSEVEYPVGHAIIAMILGIHGALLMSVFRSAGLVENSTVILVWMGSGLILTFWLIGMPE
jgi:hypothetical protein